MAEVFTYATQSIERLLNEQPDKAATILAKCYRDYKEVKHEIDSILQLSGAGKTNASRSPPKSAIPISSRGSIPVRGHTRASSSQLAMSPLDHREAMRPNTPPGSSSARSSKSSSTLGETIVLIDAHEGGIDHHPVVLRNAAIEFSLIREDIVNERLTGAEAAEEERPYVIELPGPMALSGACAEVRISEFVTLTWRRKKSAATHRTKFFLVSKSILDTDVLLGYKDSGEDRPGVYARPWFDFAKSLD